MSKDFFHIPPKHLGNVKIYTATTGTDARYQVWQKPRGASLINIIAVGGGGGGGGGFSRVAGNAGGGGGGGSSSGIARITIPAIFIPDVLYIQVGSGGPGGAASSNGVGGLNSYIFFSKTNATPNKLVQANGAASGAQGLSGTAIAGGNGGAAPAISTIASIMTTGYFFVNTGIAGVIGGAQTGVVGTDITGVWGGMVNSGAAGGAGCTTTDFAGGNVVLTGSTTMNMGSQGYYVANAAIGGIAGGGDGDPGIRRLTPFFNSGGAGGGSNNSGQAGSGGDGGYGCGGGGGGAGTTGGRGGNGGSGIIVITTI